VTADELVEGIVVLEVTVEPTLLAVNPGEVV
jgi:hypothetical protein